MSLSSNGTMTVSGSVVTLKATVGKSGGIISGSDIDPVSGQTLSSLGMGSTGHLLSIG
jgi:hypothetical protein